MCAATSDHADRPSHDDAAPSASSEVRTVRLFGLDFVDDADVDATAERILAPQPDDGRVPIVATPNVDHLVRMDEPANADVRAIVTRARYVLPDGQPIIWVSRLLRRPLTARLPGSTLVPPIWQRITEANQPVVVVASSDEIARRLRHEHPGATCIVPPFFDADDPGAVGAVADELAAAVAASTPKVVFLTVGFPKQERLAMSLLDRLETGVEPPVILLIGASFNMYFDITPRAPQWMQRSGLEWLYRFILEPRRLFRRYFVTDAKFVPLVVREIRRTRRERDAPTHPA